MLCEVRHAAPNCLLLSYTVWQRCVSCCVQMWKRCAEDEYAMKARGSKRDAFRLVAVLSAATAFTCRGVQDDGAKMAGPLQKLLEQMVNFEVKPG